jgi:signal peptidase I
MEMKNKKRNAIFEYAEAFGVALIAALILRMLVVQAFRIPTGSMKDTLLVGDFLLVNKFIYGAKTPERIPLVDIKLPSYRFPAFKEPKRGQIIVFKYPLDESLDYIKRCIALPGDTVEIKGIDVFVNGEPEGEKTLIAKNQFDPVEGFYVDYYRVINNSGADYTIRVHSNKNARQQKYGPIVVPPDHLFMLGDNRDNSQDSRYWGFMPMENIVGEAMVIYWSWDKNVPLWDLSEKIRWNRIFNIIR